MQIPSILFGSYSEGQRCCAAAIRAFLGGQPWNDAMGDSIVNAGRVEGLLVLNGPAPLLAGESHFQIFLPLAMLSEAEMRGRAKPGKLDEAVEASLSTPWGTLGVLAPKNQMVVYPQTLHRPILKAAATWWDTLDGVGPRYTVGLREGRRLWDLTTNLKYVLGKVGVDDAQLRAPLTAQGLREIIPSGLLG